MSFLPALVGLVFIAVVTVRSLDTKRYPPGPKGLPLLGAAKDHPKTEFWKTYAEWGRKYGNLGFISFHVLGRRMVVLNSLSVAEELLSRRSPIYSDRPFPSMAGHLMKREKSMFYISYNDRFKTYRRFMHQSFNTSATQQYWPLAENEARVLVANMAETPGDFVEHLRRNAAAVTMKIAYGYKIDRHGDHFVALAEEGMRVGSLAGAPGKWIVDSLPILKYWPEWLLPGGGFKKQARLWREQLYQQSLEPHNYVKQHMASGTAEHSFTLSLLEGGPEAGVTPTEHDDLVLWSAGAIYAAGADTTVASVKAFYFLMMLYPDIQRRAQAEIDALVSRERRLPKIQDRPLLPYIDAIVKEVLRWAPPAPIGLFHCTSADDEYQGYHIPKNTTVISNIWAMTHDPEMYPDPFTFNPSRFLTEDGSDQPQYDPRQIVFGFGRRICPGQHLGDASVFIQIATTIATLNLSKPIDENGRVIEPEIGFTTAIVSHVKPFKIHIEPRSNEALNLVQQDILE